MNHEKEILLTSEESPAHFQDCESKAKLLGHFAFALTGSFGLAAFDSRCSDFISRWHELTSQQM